MTEFPGGSVVQKPVSSVVLVRAAHALCTLSQTLMSHVSVSAANATPVINQTTKEKEKREKRKIKPTKRKIETYFSMWS
jgi:hypothetical protein